ncbi:MAG: T9SS type A sorting domain-containing protein [Bacteroidales bacterium]|jgi:hypothetical protein|nr:T9SS type A sorting domain-containing protein [Bacteroidales bacterium]
MRNMIQAIVLLVLISQVSFAQILPNANFETWVSEGDYEIPEGWETSNEATYEWPISLITAEKTDDAYAGDWAVRLISKNILGIVSPGFITTARFEFEVFSQSADLFGGTYFPYRPESINGYYKYTPAEPTDYCVVGAFLLKYNEGSEIPDTIGFAEFNGTEAISEYTPFTATFEYQSDEMPDSLALTILSTNFDNPIAESIMFVDNLSISMPTGNRIDLMSETETVYPNPGNGIFNLNLTEATEISIYNLLGVQVFKQNLPKGNHRLNISFLKKSQFIVRLKTASHEKTQSIIIQ